MSSCTIRGIAAEIQVSWTLGRWPIRIISDWYPLRLRNGLGCRCLVEEAQRILKAYDRTAKPKFGALRSLICPGIEAQQVCN